MNSPSAAFEAAHNLVGFTLDGGWTVTDKVTKAHNATGGTFSVSYFVRNAKGEKAFLKVLDLGYALNMQGDQLKNIEELISIFNFERETLKICREFRLKRVSSAIADGKLEIPGNRLGVYYIIFEKAECDIRKHLSNMQAFDLAWMLKSLHQVAVGISQLHKKNIAHQDVKPSNVLVYATLESKVADLGCADVKFKGSPRGSKRIAGDKGYAPPELLYGDVSPEWERRRLGTDMYMFGSLITFVFSQVSMTHAILHALHHSHRPGFWPHDYRNVLHYVRDAFGRVMTQVRAALPEPIRDDVGTAIEMLCDPDPNLRGHPKDLNANQFNFERFVSLFDRLAKRAGLGLLKV
jgi:eukaryotic-like serine/threonine-protein kinase